MNFENMINYNALLEMKVNETPFPYVIIPNFLNTHFIPSLQNDYPDIQQAGSFPLSALSSGPAFRALMEQLGKNKLRYIIQEKFNINLTEKPVLITVRGRADKNDGKIHRDSKSKLITILLYMNEDWHSMEGRLRLLYNAKDLNHYAEEVSPTAGTAIIFKVTENGWHGHKPIEGIRKVIQLNYITNAAALAKHQNRHRLSAMFKKLATRFGWVQY